jgi:segregation and condensation protein A
MLLPTPDGEEDGEEDPRAELVQQLVEYQRYREVAVALGERHVLGRDVFIAPGEEPEPPPPGEETPPPVRDASVGDLLEALRTVLKRIKPPSAHEIHREQITIRDCVQRILACFALAEEVDFETVFPPDADRGGIIVTFLALLELIKVRVLRARQTERFGPIVLLLALSSLEEAAERARDLTEMEPWRGGGEADNGPGDVVDR